MNLFSWFFFQVLGKNRKKKKFMNPLLDPAHFKGNYKGKCLKIQRKNLRELGHIQLVKRVSWSRGV